MSMILQYGSLKRPEMSWEMMPVVAVRECSWKELVTYGVSTPTVPLAKVSMNSMIQTLYKCMSVQPFAHEIISRDLQSESEDEVVPRPHLGHSLSHLDTVLEALVNLVKVVFNARSGARL